MRLAIILGICTLVLLAGCAFRTGTSIQEVNVHTGTKGITLTFLDQGATRATYADSATAVTYELANEGAHDVEGGVLSIGVEDDFLQLEGDRVRQFTIDGKSLGFPEGDRQIQTVQLRTKSLPPQTETVTTTVAVNVCYPYLTEASLTPCVDTDVFGRVATKPCRASAISLGSQGAPVAVTRIEPSYTQMSDPNLVRAEFIIHVRNAGGGQLFEVDKIFEACTPQALGRDSWNVATIRAYLGDQQLDCTPKKAGLAGLDGHLVLAKTEDFVRCGLPGGLHKSLGTFTGTMRVEVEYGYTFTTTRQLQIRRLV